MIHRGRIHILATLTIGAQNVENLVLGVLMATFLGLFVGTGISEEDAYLYRDGLTPGVTLVSVRLDSGRAGRVDHVSDQCRRARASRRRFTGAAYW